MSHETPNVLLLIASTASIFWQCRLGNDFNTHVMLVCTVEDCEMVVLSRNRKHSRSTQGNNFKNAAQSKLAEEVCPETQPHRALEMRGGRGWDNGCTEL